jgi:hypothetical protein
MPKGNNKGSKKVDPRAKIRQPQEFRLNLEGTSQKCVRFVQIRENGEFMDRFDNNGQGIRTVSLYLEKAVIPEGELELEHAPDYWDIVATPGWNS